MINPKPLWNFDEPQASEDLFKQMALATQNLDDKQILVTQVARALGLQGKYREGFELLDTIESTSPEVQSYIHIERGRLFRSSGEPTKARPEFEIAAALSKANNMQELHIDALHMIALVLPLEEQVPFTKTAIAIAKTSTDQDARNWVASLLNNLGMSYTDLNQWEEALDCFKEALIERERIGDSSRIFVARYMIGWTLRNLGRKEDALIYQLELQKDLLAAGKTDQYVSAEIELLTQEQ